MSALLAILLAFPCVTASPGAVDLAPDERPAVFAPAAPNRSKPPDPWLAWDKFWHFSASFVSVGAGYHLCHNRLGLDHPPATGISLGGTLGLGVGKELLDRYGHRGRFSWKDLAANALGVTAGYFVFVHRY